MTDGVLPDPASQARLLALTAQIVSAQVGNSRVGTGMLPELIRAVHDVLRQLGQSASSIEPERPQPAVPVRRSVHHDAITCLICGVQFKMLKRHLVADHGMTPEGYRAHWGLPDSYPMVAPDYAATRSKLAKAARLGRKRNVEAELVAGPDTDGSEPSSEPAVTEEPAPPVPAKRGRRRGAVKEATEE